VTEAPPAPPRARPRDASLARSQSAGACGGDVTVQRCRGGGAPAVIDENSRNYDPLDLVTGLMKYTESILSTIGCYWVILGVTGYY
jgi:hypothetical protein